MQRPITGFIQDEQGYWIAQLSCGHHQHVRHRPPLVERLWVLTESGRHSRLGQVLNCLHCEPIQGPLKHSAD